MKTNFPNPNCGEPRPSALRAMPLWLAFIALTFFLSGNVSSGAIPGYDGGPTRLDCSGLPAVAEVALDWRGENVVGCKVELLSSRTKIFLSAADCTLTAPYEVPASVPRSWTIVNQPPGGGAQIQSNGNMATLSLPRAGDYTVLFTICPSGNCTFSASPGATPRPLLSSTGSITIRAEAELPLRPQEQPGLPPSALVATPKLNIPDRDRWCMCQAGGGYIDPQWVTVSNWSGANDYRLVEGSVAKSWIATHDAIVNHGLATHFGTVTDVTDIRGDYYVVHDLNVGVSVDPKFYSMLAVKPEEETYPSLLGCEAENSKIPERFRPVEGDRVSLFGFWVLDCGHEPFYTEIHPIIGWAVHRNRPVRIPDNASFTFDLGGTNIITSTAGNNLYVPGIITDLWFNSDTGGATHGDWSSLAQPARCNPLCPPGFPNCVPFLGGDHMITESPIRREYEFNIYLPKNPSQVFAEVGQIKPRAPLYLKISNPHGSSGPDPDITRVTEQTNGVTYEYLRVRLDLRGQVDPTYSRRIEAAWVYPSTNNWELQQWRVSLDKLDVYDDLDLVGFGDGDWQMWVALPNADQPWTRVLDGFENAHGTITFDPPWQTGAADPVFQRRPLSLDSQRRLGPDVLVFGNVVNFWVTGYEADEGDNDGDIGRIAGFLHYVGSRTWYSSSYAFSATFSAERIATLNNGTLSPAAAQLARLYLLSCTNRINDNPVRDVLSPFSDLGMLADGISGERPWKPVDPQQVLGARSALVGDVNRDGFPDVVLGAKGTNGEARLYLGGRKGFSPAPHAIATVPLPVAAGADRVLAGAGDVDGDGVPDLLVGAPLFTFGQTNGGIAYLFSGKQLRAGGSFDAGQAAWKYELNVAGAQFGYSLAAAGDINQDGFADVIVAAPFQDKGRVYVFIGSSNGLPSAPSQVVSPQGSGAPESFGFSVAGAGDVNRDGFGDVVIGAPKFGPAENEAKANEGAVYLFYGSSTGLVISTYLLIEGAVGNEQLGYAVAAAGDVDGDHYADIIAGVPFYSSLNGPLEEGMAVLFRGGHSGLEIDSSWAAYGGRAGAHFGFDLAGVGDINGDGLGDVAIVAPDEAGPDGLHGRISYFTGSASDGLSMETWRTWGVSGVAKPPVGVRASDINADGFDDTLTSDPCDGGEIFHRVQLVLGRGQKAVVPSQERFYRAVSKEPFAFAALFSDTFADDVARSYQTNAVKIDAMLTKLRKIYDVGAQGSARSGDFLTMLQRLQQLVPPMQFAQHFGDVDLELGGAIYIDCGATQEFTDTLGRHWFPDSPFLVSSNASISVTNRAINDSLLGDRYLPQTMLQTERWFSGDIRYQVATPNGWYTVLLYFSENCPACVGPASGGTGCDTCERLFDLEVEGQRVNAYNQADAALPPNGDGQGAVFTATQVAFHVLVSDGLVDIGVLDRGSGPGRPPDNAAIKGIAILMRPSPEKFATRPRIEQLFTEGGLQRVVVNPLASLARYLAGEIPLSLQSSSNLTQWQDRIEIPQLGSNGLPLFSLPVPTNTAGFYRAVITNP